MLKVSKVKQKYRNKEMVLQTMLRFPDAGAAEIMAMAGADLIVIDNEHYPFNVSQIESIVRAVQAFGGECSVRLPNSEPKRIAQIMETGISGILIPHVESYEEAITVVNAVKYAPVGKRGFCPITRAAAYGMCMSPSEYAAFANEQTSIVLMAETKKGLEALDEILTIPEVDGIAIGPSDVSASYGLPGQPNHPIVRAAIEEGERKIIASGKCYMTIGYTPETAEKAFAMGSRQVNIGSDLQMLSNGFTKLVRGIHDVCDNNEQKGDCQK